MQTHAFVRNTFNLWHSTLYCNRYINHQNSYKSTTYQYRLIIINYQIFSHLYQSLLQLNQFSVDINTVIGPLYKKKSFVILCGNKLVYCSVWVYCPASVTTLSWYYCCLIGFLLHVIIYILENLGKSNRWVVINQIRMF